MKRQFTKAQRESIRNYYTQRKQGFTEETKRQCLDDMSAVFCKCRKARGFTACAGTLWIDWKDGTTTRHDEANWWLMKINHPVEDRK